MRLERIDYANLVTLLSGDMPLWDGNSLMRCQGAGLIRQGGITLTDKGHEVADKVQMPILALREGVPLERRSVNRADVVVSDKTAQWFKGSYGKAPFWGNQDIILDGEPPSGFGRRAVRIGALPTRITSRISGARRNQSVVRAEAYAFQVHFPTNLELICLRTRSGEGARIQAKYYDWLRELFHEPTFWVDTISAESPVLIKSNPRTGKKGALLAILLPVLCEGWPLPKL